MKFSDWVSDHGLYIAFTFGCMSEFASKVYDVLNAMVQELAAQHVQLNLYEFLKSIEIGSQTMNYRLAFAF